MSKARYKLQDLRDMEDDVITPAIAGDVLGCTGFLLGRKCQENPGRAGSTPEGISCGTGKNGKGSSAGSRDGWNGR